jgi:hypothetical protein
VTEEVTDRLGDATAAADPPGKQLEAGLVDELISSTLSSVHSVSRIACLPRFLADGIGMKQELTRRGLDHLFGDPVLGEPEVPGRLAEGRVEDRVLDHDLGHVLRYSLSKKALYQGFCGGA